MGGDWHSQRASGAGVLNMVHVLAWRAGVLVELAVVEQRCRAVLDVLEGGAPATEVAGAVRGWRGRRYMSGWPGMPTA
jgi:hypothetical protein